MAKKIDRALYGPSMTEVVLGAFLSIILGILLAALYLVTKPVETARELPKEPVPGVVYFLEGSKDSNKGRFWNVKQQQLVSGRAVTLIEDELNAAAAGLKPPAPKKGEEATEAKKSALSVGTANFRVREGELQVGVPLTLNTFDLGLSAIVQARGVFEKRGDQHAFVPSTLLVGSCRVEKLPFVSSYVMGRVYSAFTVPEELGAALAKLSEVSLDGAQLRLTP
ncbi:MAG TPA: hypothetical protein PLF88_04985 [Opitutaceae bacterium]|nr:hypothetical protein [Opitutaceae bacterium]HRJ46972.1 hypothetical protein [Opitutaceae bacterium]